MPPFVPGSMSNRSVARCLLKALRSAERDIERIAQTFMPQDVMRRAAMRAKALEDEVDLFLALAKERDARTQRRIVATLSWGLKHLLVRSWPVEGVKV